ncbi:MAG TPA: sensor histidine kinase [Tenuifilaceae bacterium]|nr:sensor histidine kinase [Tenuifilaceae bacterium]HPS05260.1 sensor histidine kinase [Tenuifilaceae bacterium]
MEKNCLKKVMLVTILAIASSLPLSAQDDNQVNVDSMLNSAKSKLYSSPNEAFELAQQVVELSVEQGNQLLLANGYKLLGAYYSDIKNDFDLAKLNYQKADSIFRHNKGEEYAKGIGAIYHSYGVIDHRLGNYWEAIQYYYNALRVLDSINDNEIRPKTLNNLSNLYAFLKDYSRAEKYSRECLRVSIENGNKQMISVVSVSLADALISQGKFEEVLSLLLKSKEIATEQENLYILELVHLNLGSYYYLSENNYEKSIGEYLQALNYAKALGSDWEVMRITTNVSEVYFLDNQLGKAMEYAEKSLGIAERMGTGDIKQRALSILAKVYASKGQYSNAYENLLKSYIIRDSVFNDSKQMHVNYLESRYHSEMKEKEIIILKNTQREHELILKRRKYQLIILITIILIVALVAAFIIVRNKYRQLLDAQKLHIQEQQIKQLEQEKQLVATQAILEGEATERKRLARDLHDGLGGMLSVVKLGLHDVKNGVALDSDDVLRFNKVLEMLDSSIRELRRVAHNMMPESLMRYGLKASLTDFCGNIPNVQFHYFGNEQRLDSKLEMMIYRTAHELVNNALKHAQAQHINIQIVQGTDRVSLIVQDDGVGFDPKVKSEGTGLDNIRCRVQLFNGTMDIFSKTGNGTEVNVEFKL